MEAYGRGVIPDRIPGGKYARQVSLAALDSVPD